MFGLPTASAGAVISARAAASSMAIATGVYFMAFARASRWLIASLNGRMRWFPRRRASGHLIACQSCPATIVVDFMAARPLKHAVTEAATAGRG